jgi:hypothetical protein
MANIMNILAYITGFLTLIFGLTYLGINTVKLLKGSVSASVDLYAQIKRGFFTTIAILFIAFFIGNGSIIGAEAMALSNGLKYMGIVFFVYACMCSVGYVVNNILTASSAVKSDVSQKNLQKIMKFSIFGSLAMLIVSWLFAY